MNTAVCKRPDEVALIWESATIVAETLELAGRLVRPGVSTREIDRQIDAMIRERGGVPSFLGYHDYPASTCISVNEQVVHGIPGDRVLEDGDIVGIDVGVYKNGFHGDAARTYAVGAIDAESERLLRVTAEALARGIAAITPGCRVGAISHAVQKHVEGEGFSIVRDLVGHGVGRKLHEEPQVPNFGPVESGAVLRPGMVLAIEPMVNAGTWEVETLADRWTVVTKDRRRSAHFEHTVAVTEHGAEILSRLV